MVSKFAHNNFLGNCHKIKTTHEFLRLVGGVGLFCFKICVTIDNDIKIHGESYLFRKEKIYKITNNK
jgi:hypothetical protein